MVLRDWLWLFFLVALDQASKLTALLIKPNSDWFQFIWNTGAGFGILQGKNWILFIIGLIVLVLVWQTFTQSKGKEHAAYLMLIAGIVGNSIDRVAHGAVIDFISIGNFPVFNVADSLITISILFLVAKGLTESFDSWHFHKIRKKHALRKKEPKENKRKKQ